MERAIYRPINNSFDILRKVSLLLSDYLPVLYKYNSSIKGRNYYLKPVHIVIKKKSSGDKIKYYYYGRYWYRIEKKNNGGVRIKWVYLGTAKPEEDLPDPPKNPLEGLVIKVSKDEFEVIASSRELYEKIQNVLISS